VNWSIRIIETITDFISGHLQSWLIFAMMVLVLVDVTSRYVLKNPLSIAEEFGGYLLVAITCMGLAYAWKEKSHVRVEFIVKSLPVMAQRWLRLILTVLALVLTAAMTYAAYELVSFSFMFGTRSGSWLRTPIAWPQMSIAAGAGLMCLQLIAEILKCIKRFEVPLEEGE